MSFLRVSIRLVQQIKSLNFEIDLGSNRLVCLVGRNGSGKTTLIRALRNLSNADTFLRTANPLIFDAGSQIQYQIDDYEVTFNYDNDIRSLNCKEEIPQAIRNVVSAELPMPYGARFNYFRSASDSDREIRQALIVGNYVRPDELIEFLNAMYSTKKYEKLVEVRVKNEPFYSIALDENRYIREDYLSSGEYFLINLYRTIKSATRLIAVDEIELSLDAAAQAQLAGWLRRFCEKYECSILFTTHSLAVMRTLDQTELRYIEQEKGETIHYPASYSYVKARLFGFHGWDKYILTEDDVLNEFIEYIIRRYCPRTFFAYKVVHIGGADQVIDLMRRNSDELFLATSNNVIAVLDGDRRTKHGGKDAVYFIPVENVEDAIHSHYNDDDFPFKLPKPKNFTSPKDAFNAIRQQRIATTSELYEYLCCKHDSAIRDFARDIGAFLGATG